MNNLQQGGDLDFDAWLGPDSQRYDVGPPPGGCWVPDDEPPATPGPTSPHAALEFADDMTFRDGGMDLIDGVLAPGDLGILYGMSGAGKTFVTLDLAAALATGQAIGGREVQRSAALYVGYEGGRGIRNRMIAVRGRRGSNDYALARVINPEPLANDGSIEAICQAAIDLKEASGLENCVVIIDTLSRAIAGADENSAKEMSALIQRISAIQNATGAAVLLVHHAGKDDDRGMRGSSVLFAACDAVIGVHRATDQEPARVEVMKSKEGVTGNWSKFALRPVEVGRRADGKPVTTCVVDYEVDKHPSQGRKRKPLSPGETRAKEYLQRLYDQRRDIAVPGSSVGLPDAPGSERWCVVEMTEWRALCRKARMTVDKPGDTPEAVARREAKAFERAVEGLDQRSEIGRYDNYVWLCSANRNRTRNGRDG